MRRPHDDWCCKCPTCTTYDEAPIWRLLHIKTDASGREYWYFAGILLVWDDPTPISTLPPGRPPYIGPTDVAKEIGWFIIASDDVVTSWVTAPNGEKFPVPQWQNP